MGEGCAMYMVVFHLRAGGRIEIPVCTQEPVVDYNQFSEGRPDHYTVKEGWGEPVLAEIDYSDVHGWTLEPIDEGETNAQV